MIKLIFTAGRETITIEVEGKIVVYRDRKFPQGIKVIPKDENFEKIVLFSRNRRCFRSDQPHQEASGGHRCYLPSI